MAHHILIIRLSAIGDVVMASPLIGALRARYPDARISWLIQPEYRDLLTADARLDEVIDWPRATWRRLWHSGRWWALGREIGRLRALLRARRFDLVLDLQGLLKSGLLAWLSGAPRRIGLGSREGSRHLMTEVVGRDGGDTSAVSSEYRHLAATLGLPAAAFRLGVALADEDRAAAARFIADHGLEGGYAVLCPFTTRPQKHWFAEHWIRLAEALERTHRLRPVLLGGPGDRAAAAAMAGARDGLVDAVGRTGLREAAALIERARLLVGVDTGLTHMGLACGTPTIALFGSTRPYLKTLSERATVLYHPLPCSPCRRNPTCGGDFTCMRLITPEQVLTKAAQLLTTPPP